MNPYEELANAIILRAIDDYRHTDDPVIIKEIEDFILSPWFGVLTKVDSRSLLVMLRKEFHPSLIAQPPEEGTG